MSGRGNLALDMIVFFVCIFVLGIFLVLFYGPMGSVMTMIAGSQAMQASPQAVSILSNTNSQFPNTFDNAGAFFFVMVWFFLLVSSYYVGTSPLFFIITLIIMTFSFMVLAYMGNFFGILIAGQAVSAAAFPKMVWMNEHLLELGIAVFFTTSIALFAKKNPQGGGL